MKRIQITICAFLLMVCGISFSEEVHKIWPGKAPNETTLETGTLQQNETSLHMNKVSCPQLTFYVPEKKTSEILMLVFPGGGYNSHSLSTVMCLVRFFNGKGITAAVLTYRVPRRKGQPIYYAPLQDAQRAIRYARSNAKKYEINPEKIGCIGFSAGAHLAVISGTNSQTSVYSPVDELDKVPCHLNFVIAVYPAYILSDGATARNTNRGTDAVILPDFRFDDRTPPMCLVHGDDDYYSSLGSVALYSELHRRKIPAQLLIFSKATHGLGDGKNVHNWEERVYDWMDVMGF